MINIIFTLLLLTISVCKTEPDETTTSPFTASQQLVVVVSSDENSTTARLWQFDKQGKTWKQNRESYPVNLGRTGLAWGRGLHEAQPGYQKKEGDGKSPAGIFRFGTAFGYAPGERVSFKTDYLQLTKEQVCVEDVNSRYYNQIVNETEVEKDWNSNEAMRRDDELYKWGLMVEHNVPAAVGSGSCIFFHLWREEGIPTLGCTAMTEQNLLALMQWLDPGKKPLLVQLTEKDYSVFQKIYELPALLGN